MTNTGSYGNIILTKDNTTHKQEEIKMARFNTIYTPEEYMAQGFEAWEVPYVTRHDILFNKYVMGIITEEEDEEMSRIIKMLGL